MEQRKSYANSASSINNKKTDKKQKTKSELSNKTKYGFNLPAFVLPVIYNILVAKRIGFAIVFLILTWLPHFMSRGISSTGYLLLCKFVFAATIVLAIISGITANIPAYAKGKYMNEQDFLKYQQLWIPAVAIAIIVHLIIFPVQQMGHRNTVQMIRFAEVKDTLKLAIMKGSEEGKTIGINVLGTSVQPFFSKYLNASVTDEGTLRLTNGADIKIEGYEYECGRRYDATYHEQKTSCATVTIDLDGPNRGPNKTMSLDQVKKVKSLLNHSTEMGDIYTLYLYSDDLAPKEGSVEKFALERFEK